jgi:N-formylglutamate amidohydrolase
MALAKERTQMDDAPTSLLAADEPQPVTVTNEGGRSPFVIVADHAGKYLPRRLQMLGLQEAECARHIAWDIGAGAVCCLIGDALCAVVIRQNYSRLAIDCTAPVPCESEPAFDCRRILNHPPLWGTAHPTIRLSQDSNICSTNLIDGAGRQRYGFPR